MEASLGRFFEIPLGCPRKRVSGVVSISEGRDVG